MMLNIQVWANIQDYDDPGRIVFDLSNTKHWRPLFPSNSQPLSSVQQDLHYTETDVGKVKELQERYVDESNHIRLPASSTIADVLFNDNTFVVRVIG